MDTIIAQAQAVVDALKAYAATLVTPATITEVDVKESDGTEIIATPSN